MCVCLDDCRWIRLPAIIYGSHVATTLIPILYHIMAAAGPMTVSERMYLSAVYVPYLIVPLLLVYYMLTSVHYQPLRLSSLKQH